MDEGHRNAIEERVARLVLRFAREAPVERPLDRGLSLRRDLAIDSLNLISLLFRFEEELRVDLAAVGDLDLEAVETVGDLCAMAQTLCERAPRA